MYSPELHLARVSETLREVLVAAAGLDLTEKDRGVVDRLRASARQIIAARLLYDMRAIAVTGMQGVGKTTFVTRLFGLPDELLPHDAGRDEKVPVVIREHAGPVRASALYMPGGTASDLSERPVKDGQLHALLRNPPQELALVYVYVPYRVFHDESQALVLLPGLEASLQDRPPTDPWDALVRHALLSSAACIFVSSPQKLADGEAKGNMQRLQQRFSGLRPLVVVTHADLYSDEVMKGYLETAREQLGVSDADGAIAVGNTENLTQGWRPKVLARLAEFSGTSAQLRAHQLAQSRELAEQHLCDSLSALEEIAVARWDRIDGQEYRQVDQVIAKFQRSSAKTRELLRKKIVVRLNQRRDDVKSEVTASIVDEGFWRKVGRVVFGESLADVDRQETKLHALWSGSGAVETTVLASAAEIARESFQPLFIIPSKSQAGISSVSPSSLSARDRPLLEHDDLADARWLLGPVDEDAMPGPRILEATQRLPALALAFVAESKALNMLTSDVARLPGPRGGLTRPQVEAILGDVRNADEMRKRTIATFATVILGADAADGTVDSIPAIANALGIQLSTAAVNVLAGVAALVGVAALALSVRKQLIHADFAQRDRAMLLVQALRDATEAQVLDTYDGMMDRISEEIQRRLNAAHHIDDKLGRVQRLKIAVARAQQARVLFAQAVEYNAGAMA